MPSHSLNGPSRAMDSSCPRTSSLGARCRLPRRNPPAMMLLQCQKLGNKFRRGRWSTSPLRRTVQRRLSAKGFIVAVRRQILEARVLADKGHMHGADRPVTLLADNDLGQPPAVGVVRIIDLVT